MLSTKIKLSDFILLSILGILAFALYLWGVNAPFYFDDNYNILKNNFVHDLSFFFKYFTDPATHNVVPENAPYRPLCTLVYSLLWAAGGGSTLPFHLYKIVLHVLAAFFAFKIYQKIFLVHFENLKSNSPQLFFIVLGAIVFLIHPANSETVNYISSTSTLQCSVLYLAAFYFFLSGKNILMSVLFAAALFTKEEGATLPAAIVLYGLIFMQGKINKKALACSVAVLFAFLAVYLSMPQTVNFSNVDRYSYLFTQFRAWLQYITWIFFPFGFSIEHRSFGFSSTFWDYKVILSLVFHLFVLGFTFFALVFRKKNISFHLQILLFGIVLFYLAMMPTSSIFALFEPINEHRYYLSYALLLPAIFIYLGAISYHLNKKILIAMTLVILIGLSALSFRQVQIWRSPAAVWQNAIDKDPTNGKAFLNLGVLRLGQGQYDQAIEYFNQCLDLIPNYKFCSLNLAITWDAKGDLEKAQNYYANTYILDPNFVLMLAYFGEFLIRRQHNYVAGLEMQEQCSYHSKGGLSRCFYGKAMALRAQGKLDEALKTASELAGREPHYTNRFDVGLSLVALKKYDEAYLLFDKLWRKNLSDTQSIHNMAWIEMQRNNWPQAKELWLKKLSLVEDDRSAWEQLQTVAVKLNDQKLLEQARQKLK